MRVLILCILLLLSGCSTLSNLAPSGPQVNTNAQVGAENTQQVVANQSNTNVQGDQKTSQVDAQSVSEVRISNTTIDPLVLLLLVLGWLLPSPGEMYKEVKSWFRKDKK